MTAETLHLNYIRDLLGVRVPYTTTTDVNIVAVPCLVHVISIDVTTVSATGNACVKLVDAITAVETPVRWVFQSVELGVRLYVLPKPVLFAVGVRAFLDQTTGIGTIGIMYEVTS